MVYRISIIPLTIYFSVLSEFKADRLHPHDYSHTPTKNVGHVQPTNAHDPFH